MRHFNIQNLAIGLTLVAAVTSCTPDETVVDPPIPNEEEVITTLDLTMTPVTGGESIVLSFRDIDGDGPNDPVITVSDSLAAETAYIASLLLLNETENPADTVNAEIIDEDEEHQFFFITNSLDLDVTYADMDSNDQPIGLSTIINTGAATEGTLTVILRHEPNKSGDGVEAGDIANAGGETDIEAEFNVVID